MENYLTLFSDPKIKVSQITFLACLSLFVQKPLQLATYLSCFY